MLDHTLNLCSTLHDKLMVGPNRRSALNSICDKLDCSAHATNDLCALAAILQGGSQVHAAHF
jgi:hypothetical protein